MKSLFKTVSLIVIFSVLTRAFGFIFRIYLSRKLGAETLGIYQVGFSVFSVLLTIIASGLPLVISRLTAKYKQQKDIKSERKMLTCALVIAMLSSIILAVITIIICPLLGFVLTDAKSVSVLMILLPALLFSAIYHTFRGSLWGHSQYFGVCLAELVEQVCRILFCVLILETTLFSFDNSFSPAISLTLASVISSIFVFVLYFVQGRRLAKPKNHYKEILKITAPITGVRIASSLLQPLIAIIIPLRLVAYGYTNAQALSQYGVATGMTLPLLFIPMALIGSLSMALVPDISAAVTKQDTNHINNRIKSSVLFSLFISIFFVPLYIGAGEFIGIFFYNNSMSGTLLASSAWLMIPLGLINITSTILNALGLENKSLLNYIPGSILMLLGLWFLPKYIGINAMTISMGLCFTIAAILNLVQLKKQYKESLNLLKPFLCMCLFCIPVTAITSFLCNILNHFLPLFFTLAISCLAGAICFLLLCLIFNVLNLSTILIKVKEKFNYKKKTFLLKNKA